MNNKQRNVHKSGPLSLLMRKGLVKPIDDASPAEQAEEISNDEPTTKKSSLFKTQSGIEFKEDELVQLNPEECAPWKYANRQEQELGDIDELIESIRNQSQLQPALVRPHPSPTDTVKYEVIFGRRRLLACTKLNIPLLAIFKKDLTIPQALACQDAENKFRKDVSPYSNAILYKKLLQDDAFINEKELAKALNVSYSSLNDLMSFNRIPNEILDKVQNPHVISVSMALQILAISKKSAKHRGYLESIAHKIGQQITSARNLEIEVDRAFQKNIKSAVSKPVVVTDKIGNRIFTVKTDAKGALCLSLDKSLKDKLDVDLLCEKFQVLVSELTS